MTFQISSRCDFDDLITGAKILGCGGGGEESLANVRADFMVEHDLAVTIISPNDLTPTDFLCVSGMVGGRHSPEYRSYTNGLEESVSWPMLTATHDLQSFLSRDFTALISTEIGAGNFLAPMLVAARMGIAVVDGDLCGRAKPEISISTSNLTGLSITPLSIVSRYDDRFILATSQTDQRAEDLARKLSVLSGGSIGVARCPHFWKEYQKAVLPDSISKSRAIGSALRAARSKGRDPLPRLAALIEGSIVFQGKVSQFQSRDVAGFVVGELLLRNSTSVFKIWFKNEYLVSWLNDEPFVTAPDLLCVVDSVTGEGLTPWAQDFPKDRSVTVLAAPNAKIWHTPHGLALFGPKHFGFDIPYRTIDDLLSTYSL
ncbi:MAG: DUF917 domain-containing protein [Asgard group archaeon]|nr:DUF917 domain-containing protein [Asgard group archaeon]